MFGLHSVGWCDCVAITLLFDGNILLTNCLKSGEHSFANDQRLGLTCNNCFDWL